MSLFNSILEREFLIEFPKGSSSLLNQRPLRIKFGIDPTRSQLHLGHFVPLRVLRSFQNMGHEIHLVLGSFTAQLGDPSGQNQTRPILSAQDVKQNATEILNQVEQILSPGFHVHWNHEFFENMPLPFFLTQMASRFNVANLMARDGFKSRGQNGIAMHELLVPLLQGWDSVELKAEVELGGTDQLFNFQIARELQRHEGQQEEICLMTPIINGTDGRKMSKSADNCIFLQDAPEEIFGKVMSIPDSVAEHWLICLTDLNLQIKNPMERKKELAFDLVFQLKGREKAELARQHFEKTVQQHQPVDIQKISPGVVLDLIQQIRQISKSSARKLILGGGVSINEEKIMDPNQFFTSGTLFRIGKRQWFLVED